MSSSSKKQAETTPGWEEALKSQDWGIWCGTEARRLVREDEAGGAWGGTVATS